MNLEQQGRAKYYDRIDIAQLVVSILVFFLSLIWMGLAGLAAFGQVTLTDGSTAAIDPGLLIGLLLTGLVFAVIALISIVTTIQKITGHAQPRKLTESRWMIWSIVAFLMVFGLAALVAFAFPEIKAIAFPILSVPAIAIPVFWLLRVGARERWRINPKRNFGILTFSVGVSTPFITLIELLVFIIVILVVLSGLFTNPRFMELFNTIVNNPALLETDPIGLLSEFETLFDLTSMMGGLLLVIAGIMPLVEELFKTLGVWLLKVRNPDPGESFMAGLLCGAGFALLEGLVSVSSLQGGSIAFADWAGVILGRFGGSLLHILTGGIIGLAIGKFWQNRRFGSLVFSYLAAWLLHAAWNALAIFGGFNPLMTENQVQAVWPYVGLVILFVGMAFAFLRLLRNVGATKALSVQPTEFGG